MLFQRNFSNTSTIDPEDTENATGYVTEANLRAIDEALIKAQTLPISPRDHDESPELRSATPFVSPEESQRLCEAEVLAEERQAARELVELGCSPCYSIDLGVPSKTIHELNRGIIEFWRIGPPSTEYPLRAQLKDWKAFRKSRAGSDGVAEPAQLLMSYHSSQLKLHAKLIRIKKQAQKALDTHTGDRKEGLVYQLDLAEGRCRRHESMLLWLENECMILKNVQESSADTDKAKVGTKRKVTSSNHVCETGQQRKKVRRQVITCPSQVNLNSSGDHGRKMELRRTTRIRRKPDRFVP